MSNKMALSLDRFAPGGFNGKHGKAMLPFHIMFLRAWLRSLSFLAFQVPGQGRPVPPSTMQKGDKRIIQGITRALIVTMRLLWHLDRKTPTLKRFCHMGAVWGTRRAV